MKQILSILQRAVLLALFILSASACCLNKDQEVLDPNELTAAKLAGTIWVAQNYHLGSDGKFVANGAPYYMFFVDSHHYEIKTTLSKNNSYELRRELMYLNGEAYRLIKHTDHKLELQKMDEEYINNSIADHKLRIILTRKSQ